MTNFKKVNPKQSFPELEQEIIKFWKENDTFKKSIKNREDSEEFNFYDGPPFATGTPHYGHILAGTIKDVIPRYQTMIGKKVERKFGWDTHGLPIENIVEKKLEISGKEDIEEKIGVHKFNECCRENVFGYVDEWRKTVERMGRWVDMDNDYKTMETDFMESVWWVYKTIYDKGLIYEGNRIVPYCPRCTTPLSNFEVNQGYKDKQSKTVTVKFKIKGSENKYILAWTTTPWTLYANLGLAVGENIDYVEILDKTNGDTYILAKEKLKDYYKNENDFKILREYKGSCLVGIKYEPLFPDFKIQLDEMAKDLGPQIKLGKNSYSVVLGHHVTTETGTGIVHTAPAYGEDDNIIGKEQDLGFVAHVNDAGKTCNLLDEDKNGQFIFDFNENVIKELKENKLSVNIGTINHSYPHCWRCDTPLIYRAISAWYVDVTAIKDKMIANNRKINWVPDDIKNGRMGKWLEGARDWNISRNRYWGSAIPVWQNEDKSEEVCIGSIEELYEANKDYGQITKVIFVRHGRTDYNEKGLFDYKNEAKLTEVGKSQANDIKKIFENENIEAIYSSPLDRCIDTVTPLANSKNLEIQKIDDLIEVNATELQGKKSECINFTWDNGYGGGEKICEVYDRIEKVMHKIINENKGKTIVVCSHGDPTFLARMSLHNDIDYSQKYTSDKYLKNNPKKADISKIYGVEYVYTKTKKAVDLHKHFVDEIFVKHPKTGEKLKRIPEVLDCWFESGSMPYASKHYMGDKPHPNPLLKGEGIKSNPPSPAGEGAGGGGFKFPADFIAEGLDQTRGWFYTLLILGTALFDNTPFLNCIVNGIVLAEDGKKMSKSLQNYPDPELIFSKYGADAMRFYLLNSPVVEAQDFRFAESGVEEVVKKVILPLWNTYYFFTTYANIDNFKPTSGRGMSEGQGDFLQKSNILDKWLISELNELTKEVRNAFDNYELNKATKPIFKFMDNLTNWYIRRSRKRFWKSENDGDKIEAYETLYFTLVELCKIIAPFMPFVSEYIYKNLSSKESVHLDDFPIYDEKLIDKKLNADTDKIQKIITLGLSFRANKKIRVRQPLKSLTITENFSKTYEEILKEELNIKEILVVDGEKLAKKICKPNGRNIGPKFGKDVKFIMSEAKAGNFEELENGNILIPHPNSDGTESNSPSPSEKEGFLLEAGDFELEYIKADENAEIEAGFGMVISMDSEITKELELEGFARDIVRHIQEARKEAEYNVEDRIGVELKSKDGELRETIENFKDYIEKETLSSYKDLTNSDFEKEIEIEGKNFSFKLKK